MAFYHFPNCLFNRISFHELDMYCTHTHTCDEQKEKTHTKNAYETNFMVEAVHNKIDDEPMLMYTYFFFWNHTIFQCSWLVIRNKNNNLRTQNAIIVNIFYILLCAINKTSLCQLNAINIMHTNDLWIELRYSKKKKP